MSQLHQLAVRGCLIAGVVLLTAESAVALDPPERDQPPTQEADTNSQPGAAEGEQHTNQTQADTYGSPAIDRPITGHANDTVDASSADKEAKNRNRYPDCPYNDVDECDLLAQKDMAASTREMAYAAWIGVALSAIAVGFIWLTMRYTAKAANYTRGATVAAEAAVCEARKTAKLTREMLDITRDIAALENRAWVKDKNTTKPSNYTSDEFGCRFGVDVTVENIGRSPAYSVDVVGFGIPVTKTDELAPFKIHALREGYRVLEGDIKHTLFPQETILFPVDIAFLDADLETLRRQQSKSDRTRPRAMAVICIFYRVGGDQEVHETIRAFMVDQLDFRDKERRGRGELRMFRFDRLTGSVT